MSPTAKPALGAPAAPEPQDRAQNAPQSAPSPVTQAAFAEALSHLAASVWVVSAGEADQRLGRTVTSLMTVSAAPPTLVVSIAADSALARLIPRIGGYSLSLLGRDQREIGNAFAGARPAEERFALGTWSVWSSRRPRLEGAVIGLDVALETVVASGSHSLFLGRVVQLATTGRPPLLWHRRGYRDLSSTAN